MRQSQNIWVDGSLRDGNWFSQVTLVALSQVFTDIRRRYPHYKIAIFVVSAPESLVRKRVAMRAQMTGRSVPEDMIEVLLSSPFSSYLFL